MVIFSDMKGGSHLSDQEAQLTYSELKFYERVINNKKLREHHITTKVDGTIIDQCTSRSYDKTKNISLNMHKKYHLPKNSHNLNTNISKILKKSILIHNHPWSQTTDPLNSQEEQNIDDDFRRYPPIFNDILVDIFYAPIQGIILNRYGLTITEIPPEIKINSLYIRKRKIYSNINNYNTLCNKSYNTEKCKLLWKYFPNGYKSYKNLKRSDRIKSYLLQTRLQIASEVQQYSNLGLKTTFINNIDIKTGVGKIGYIPIEIIDIASDMKPINGLHNIFGEKIYCGNRLIVKGHFD